jgi:hypothetical protein
MSFLIVSGGYAAADRSLAEAVLVPADQTGHALQGSVLTSWKVI